MAKTKKTKQIKKKPSSAKSSKSVAAKRKNSTRKRKGLEAEESEEEHLTQKNSSRRQVGRGKSFKSQRVVPVRNFGNPSGRVESDQDDDTTTDSEGGDAVLEVDKDVEDGIDENTGDEDEDLDDEDGDEDDASFERAKETRKAHNVRDIDQNRSNVQKVAAMAARAKESREAADVKELMTKHNITKEHLEEMIRSGYRLRGAGTSGSASSCQEVNQTEGSSAANDALVNRPPSRNSFGVGATPNRCTQQSCVVFFDRWDRQCC